MTNTGIEWLKENGSDGWSIWKPEGVPWADLDLSAEDRQRLTQIYKSDRSSPTSTIFKDGKIVDRLEGVHNLPLLGAIAAKLGVGNADGALMGRGSRARALTAAILRVVQSSK